MMFDRPSHQTLAPQAQWKIGAARKMHLADQVRQGPPQQSEMSNDEIAEVMEPNRSLWLDERARA